MHPTIGPLASRRTHDSTRRTPTPDLPHTRYADTRGLAAARAINGAVAAGAPDVAATLAAHARTIEAPDHALTIALARVDVLAGRPDDALRRLDAVGGARPVLVAAAAWAGGRRD
ncbi:MAG: hypothetical protein KDA25_04270, partial [Phycisphaerales bacterium]|nr:hypothetical protein [Phycisphaerales bacterium]